MTDLLIRASFDTFNNEDSPGVNYGDSAKLSVRTQSSHHRYSFLHFPLNLIQGATVTSATLTFYLRGTWTGTTNVTASRVTEKWRESTASYSVPSAGGPNRSATHAASAAVVSGVDGQACVIDVTAIAQDWASGAANYGFRLESDTTAINNLYSSESADRTVAPTLSVSYVLPPDPPTNLRPDASRAVSSAAPLLLWDSDTPAQVWVQIDNNSDLSSPTYDSGYVAQVQQQWDSTNTDGSFPASLTNNTHYYWRVRIKDSNGVESDWSDIADFFYQTLAATTITAPTNGGTVTTTTPTITHTLGGGRTQAFTSYVLTENGTATFTREKLPSVATSYVLPAGYVRDTAAAYAINVRVWDTLNREVIGTALDYTEDTNAFTLATGATAGVTNLAVTGVLGHVHIVWQRSADPDYFLLRVDGVIVGDPIDPADVTTTALHYAFDFYRAAPSTGTAAVYEVLAETSGIVSGTNPSVSFGFAPFGLWVIDETNGDECLVLDRNAVQTDIGESGATFYLLGRRAPVRVTDNIRGLEGTFTGRLATTPTQTVADAHAAFQAIKGRSGQVMRLVYGHRNIPVVLGQAHDELDTTPEETYLVSADFTQDSEFEIPWA